MFQVDAKVIDKDHPEWGSGDIYAQYCGTYFAYFNRKSGQRDVAYTSSGEADDFDPAAIYRPISALQLS